MTTGSPTGPDLRQQPPVDPPETDADGRDDGGHSFWGAVRLLLAVGAGKAGVALFALMVAVSAWVLLTYPRDFGPARWSDPGAWAANPKAAPPAWTTWLGNGGLPHETRRLAEPIRIDARPQGELRTYDFAYDLDTNAFPEFLSVTLTGVTYHTPRPPTVVATLLRPDGGEIRLANVPISAPREGETAPYRRFYDTPERVLLSSQDTAEQHLAQFFGTGYPGIALPSDLSARLGQALFGTPAADGSGRFVPLRGGYTFRVQVLVPDAADAVAPIDAVFAGTVFGVMGTDLDGKDLWEGLLFGFPAALLIATLAALFSTVVGAGLGIVSGYAGGATDAVIQRLSDIVMIVPKLPLLIFLVFVLGPSLWLIVVILVALSWPGLTIEVRAMVLQLRSGLLVEAARALGASRARIMARHVFPQVAPFAVARMIVSAPGAIVDEAALSFLGLGDPAIPTWGQMLEAGFSTGALYAGYWWWVVPPGALLIATALAFILLALAVEPIVDPRLRRPS